MRSVCFRPNHVIKQECRANAFTSAHQAKAEVNAIPPLTVNQTKAGWSSAVLGRLALRIGLSCGVATPRRAGAVWDVTQRPSRGPQCRASGRRE